jgi:hypothetical protein
VKMRTLRRLRTMALRPSRRRFDLDLSDVTMEPDPGPLPEAVFDRLTGPFDRRRALHMPGVPDEET